MQKLYSIHEHFKWVPEPDGTYWYTIDVPAAEKAALQKRNAEAKTLAKQGYRVRKFSLGIQRLSFGGIGTNKPHIELMAKCYALEAE